MNEINGMEIRQHERRYYNSAQKEARGGKRIAFVNRRNCAPGIHTTNSDGTKQKKASRVPAVVFQPPSFSPNGERMAFVSRQVGPLNIYKTRADGARPVNLTNDPAGDFTPDWQPLK